jgi:hypothetical protein
MRSSAPAVLALALALVPVAGGQAQQPQGDSATAQRTQALLGTLSDDSLEGRDTGSRGSAAAARIIAAELARAGLQPAGDSGWFQRVPVARQTITNPQTNQSRRVMRLQPSLATRDTFPAADRVTAVNVLGIIPGSDPVLRDEAVVLTAHYDHTGTTASGGCTAKGADTICNGADDDASGTVAVIEMARLLAQSRPRRTVVVLLVTGEERGLLGTRWYIEHPAVPLERTAANLNMEMIGRPDSLAGGAGKGWFTGFERSTIGASLRAAGIPLVPDPRPEMNFFERSDNIAFARRGIPAHTISSYNMHSDYHTPSDEARLADAAHMAAIINASARAAQLLADGERPQWLPGGQPQQPPRRP